MESILLGLGPVFALILLGAALRHFRMPGDEFWPLAEKATYFVFFPALLFNNLARADLTGLPVASMILALCGGTLIVAGLSLLSRRLMPLDGPAFSSVFQGSIRINTFVCIAVAAALYGERGLTLAAIAMASMIPLINLLCVWGLLHYASPHRQGMGAVVIALAKNPLILACLMGIAWNLLSLPYPRVAEETVAILGRASLTLGLLAVGAGLDVRASWSRRGPILLSSALKLAVAPLIFWALARLLHLGPEPTAIAVVFGSVPTAVSSYILARQLGGDTVLMAGIITAEVILAAISMPMALLWLT